MKYGLDVSVHQGAIDYSALKLAEFNIIRGGYGNSTSQKDTYADRNFTESIGKGYFVGEYWASYAKDEADARTEAQIACQIAESYKAAFDTAIFFDFEYFSSDYILKAYGIQTTPQLVQELTTAFCEEVKAQGYQAGVYYNKDYYDRFYGDAYFAAHADYLKWYARPGLSKPDKPCDIWQYASNNGAADFGYNGNIDKNIAYIEFDENYIVNDAMKPLSETPVRISCGFASSGDVETINTYINGLGITTAAKDGFVVTDIQISRGDQCYIMTLCNNLGVPCEIYSDQEFPLSLRQKWKNLNQNPKPIATQMLPPETPDENIEESVSAKAVFVLQLLEQLFNWLKKLTKTYL